MGVHGLWRLIEPSGKPVPLETLENKVLAVDVSIWLHQTVKGFQDARGASVPNAHLLGIYHRVCKLLYFKIKPVFVFDGGVPALKKQTIAKRTQSKLRNISETDKIQRQLLSTLLKHSAVSKVLSDQIEASIANIPKMPSRRVNDDLYVLPQNSDELESTLSTSDDNSDTESSTGHSSSPSKNWDLHTIDMNSVHFKSLPVDTRHEILTDLKETRKQSSWGRLHEIPKVSDDFSDYQMKRLLKRQAVQLALEEAEKEMGGKSLSLAELESMLRDQGVIKTDNVGKRIASDENKQYLLVKDVKKAMEEARQKESVTTGEASNSAENQENETSTIKELKGSNMTELLELQCNNRADQEYEEDLQKAIALSLECQPSTPDKNNKLDNEVKKLNPAEFSFLESFTDGDFVSSSSDDEEQNTHKSVKSNLSKMSSAASYMREYSGLTFSEISKIIEHNSLNKTITRDNKLKKPSLPSVTEVIESSSETKDWVENLSEVHPVEIMSASGSSDSEVDDKLCSEEQVVVINPNKAYDERDDLFADIFKSEAIADNSVSDNQPLHFEKADTIVAKASTSTGTNEKSTAVIRGSTASMEAEAVKAASEKDKPIVCDARSVSPSPILSTDKDVVAIVEESPKQLSSTGENQTEHKAQQDACTPTTASTQNTDAKKDTQKDPALTHKDLEQLKEQLQQEKADLIVEKSTKERMAGNITDQMYQEAQELLELFGVPYLIAPMEAEAQCAFLDAINLTDGTITDDSDIWLFGGQTVYKNFFNQSKYVMEFKAEDIKHHFKLSREQMVLLALLVGSDYTVGLQGVGPVTAMEILAAFPPGKGKMNEFNLSHGDLISGLKEFRSWFTKGKSPGAGRSSLKSKLKNVSFTDNFPSLQVVEAYLDPRVETSKEPFSWGVPNAAALVEYARDKFGWTSKKTEEILNPVLKRLEERRHQKTMKDYFKTRYKIHSGEAEKKMSKRVKSAITNMGRDPSEVLVEELQEDLKKKPRKKRDTKRKVEITVAPEFVKDETSKKTKKNEKSTENAVTIKRSNRTLMPNSSNDSKDVKPTNGLKNSENTADLADSSHLAHDVSEKIGAIRRRRKIKEAKAGVEIKKAKVDQEQSKRSSQVDIVIPRELQTDEEVGVLADVVSQSDQKIEEINKVMEEKLKRIEAEAIMARKSIPLASTSGSSTRPHRPENRQTRLARKESIPQKERDQTTLLRNKLKAIEVFRKGKQGPGFVPKKGRKKVLPKEDAELSESSDE